MKISVVVSIQNDEVWIRRALIALLNQDHHDFEVIVIDAGLSNETCQIVNEYSAYNVVLLQYAGEYVPGKALNMGAQAACGDFLVFLSSNCIPMNDKWLERLAVCFLEDENIAAVYGKQEPLPGSSAFEQTHIWTLFGTEKRVQKEDASFDNGNAMIRRKVWEKIAFDEQVKSLGAHEWAQRVIADGYWIYYEPHAGVYRCCASNQGASLERIGHVGDVVE